MASLAEMLGIAPVDGALFPISEEAQQNAKNMGLLQAGLGILANSRGKSFGQAIGAGGMQGLQGYQTNLQQLQQNQMMQAMRMAQLTKMKQDAADKEAKTKGLELAGAEAAKIGQPMGAPTVDNAANPQTYGYQDALRTILANPAAAPYALPILQQFKQLQPQLKRNVEGGQVTVTDETGNVIRQEPLKAAPSSIPFQLSDLTPAEARAFDLSKGAAGATRVTNNVNSFTPASEEAQKDFMKGLRTSYDSLRTAPVTLANIERAKALIPSAKGFMAPGGESALEAAKFLNNRLGTQINTEGVKSAEELRSRIFFRIMDDLKKMDAQPSQMQQQMMMDALGKLGTDPNAMPAILDAYAEVVRGKVDIHNRDAQGAIERGVKFPYNPLIELTSPQAAPKPTAPAAARKRYDPVTGTIK